MNENIESRNTLIIKWLQVLIYSGIVSLINSLISYLPFVSAALTTWISRGIMAAVVISMFHLAPINGRYRKAAIFRAVMLACALFTAYVFGSTVLTLAASLFSILAVYQEYSAHSELVAEKDPKLSGKWHSLFNWGIAASLLVSFGSTVAVLVLTMQGLDAARTSSIIIGILKVPQFVIDVVYLLYLKKVIQIFKSEGTAG